MLLPSSIQRAEDLVGMAMPTVPLSCAKAEAVRAKVSVPNARAESVDVRRFILSSHGSVMARFCVPVSWRTGRQLSSAPDDGCTGLLRSEKSRSHTAMIAAAQSAPPAQAAARRGLNRASGWGQARPSGSPQPDAGFGSAVHTSVEQEDTAVMGVGRASGLVHALVGRGDKYTFETGPDKSRTARLPGWHGDTPDEFTFRGIGVKACATPDGAPDSSLGVDDGAIQPS